MKHAFFAVVLGALAALSIGCGSSSSTTPTQVPPANPTFTATLSPASEAPNAVTNAEASASGSVTITFVLSRDAAGTVTGAVGTAVVTMQGFPANSSITLAHIHTGAAGVAGPVLINFLPPSPPLLPTSGSASFTQTSNITATDATNIMNNPAGFYFNVHTALNPGGVMRGQLRVQ